MDRYHSIVWPMVGYHWKTIESNGCQTKNHRKTIEPNGCQTKKTSGPMVDRPKTIEKPLVPMVSSKPFIQWQWWPWKPLMFHNGSNHSPKTPCLGRLNKLTIILIKYIKFVSSPRPNSTSPPFWVPISAGKGPHFTQKWVPILTNLGPHFDEFRSPFWQI